MNNTQSNNISKIFNLTLSIMSLLNGYAFVFMRGFSIAMVIATTFAVYSAIVYIKGNKKLANYQLFGFIIYAFMSTVFTVLCGDIINIRRIIFTVMKLCVWACYVTFGGGLYFDFKQFIGYAKNVIVITFIYLLFQYFVHYTLHLDLPASFNLGLIKANYDNYEIVYQASNSVFRPGSFWTEPGYLGYYYTGFLCICLFGNNIEKIIKHRNTFILISCVGIVLSLSTGAMGIMLILLTLRMITGKNGKVTIRTVLGLASITLIVCSLLKMDFISQFKGLNSSFDNTIYKLQHLETEGRVGGSFEYVKLMSITQRLFGVGVGNELAITDYTYFNGIVTLILWVGYAGVIAWSVAFFRLFKGSKTALQRMMLIVFLVDGLYASIFFGAHSFIYLIISLYYGSSEYESKTKTMDKECLDNRNEA